MYQTANDTSNRTYRVPPADLVPRVDRSTLIVASLVLGLVLFGVFAFLNRHFQLDDALIYHRYFQNALDGNGLVYNVGERHNGLTSPLFTFASLLLAWLLSSVSGAQVLLAVTGLVGTILLTLSLVRGWLDWRATAFVPLSIATFPFFYFLFGLETPLLLGLSCLALWLFDRKLDNWLPFVGGLLLLVRGESAFLLLALGFEYVRQGRRLPPIWAFLPPIVLLAAAYGFNWWYYGAPLPDTLGAKIQQGRSGLWGRYVPFLRLKWHFGAFFDRNALLLGLNVALMAVGMVRARGLWINRVLLVSLSGFTAFYLLFQIPSYYWYFAPYALAWVVYAAFGVDWLVRSIGHVSIRAWRLAFGALAACFVVTILVWNGTRTGMTVAASGPDQRYKSVAEWLVANVPSESKVAMAEVGTVGWYSGLHLIDICGLVTPGTADFIGRRDLDGWLRLYQPDYILIHDPAWRIEMGATRALASGRFSVVETFHVEGLRLLRSRARK